MKNYLLITVCTFSFLLTVSANGKDTAREIAENKGGRNLVGTGPVISSHANDSVSKEMNILRAKVNEQSEKIDQLLLELKNKRSARIREFIISIILSIVAAIIFWFAFAFLPERHRRNKLRPKLELDAYHIYRTLFSVFDSVMRYNNYSPSSFQERINGGKLDTDDIELGLQNKCLNESYFYDDKVGKLLLPTGQGLFEKANKLDETTEKIFNFSTYLSTTEILLLEQIRKKLQVYDLRDYSRNAVSIIGGIQYMPVNPSLAYMKNNLSELYKLFIQLQHLVFKYRYVDRDVFLNKVQCYYYSGQYDKCKKVISIALQECKSDTQLLEFYSFLCDYMSGRTFVAYEELEALFKNKPHLVSSRGFLKKVVDDPRIKELIENSFSKAEIEEFYSVLSQEMIVEKTFIEQAKRLKDYYQQKANSVQSSDRTA